jgi:hypothetical protein
MRPLRNNQILRIAVLAGPLALLPAGPLFAGPIAYLVTVNTSAISGTSGFLDFGFAPGFDSQSAFATISSFVPGGSLSGSPVPSGGVSGVLPGTITIDNSTAFNDYFQGFDFGTTIQFLLSFGGPAITSPDGTSSGSTFGFGMFQDSGGTIPLLTTDPFGNTFTVDVNSDGSTTPTTFPADAFGAPPVATLESAAPEPAPCALLALGLAVLFARGAVSKKKTRLYSVFRYAIKSSFSASLSMSL